MNVNPRVMRAVLKTRGTATQQDCALAPNADKALEK
jgi:hypothetical protein